MPTKNKSNITAISSSPTTAQVRDIRLRLIVLSLSFMQSKYEHEHDIYFQDGSGGARPSFPDVQDIIDMAGALTSYVRYGSPL